MISISEEARHFILERNQPIHLDMPPVVQSFTNFQECPMVRFGVPYDPENYVARSIQGIPVYLPRRMPEEGNFTLILSSFLGFRWVTLDGWCLY